MKITYSENGTDESKLTIVLEGKISSDNAPSAEETLCQMIEGISDRKLVLDLNHLTYISSAGLRVLLFIKKKYNLRISLINVHPEIAEILHITGMTEIFEMNWYMRECSIEGCKKLGQGASGEVFILQDDAIIKVFHSNIPLETIERERNLSRSALIAGIPTAIPFETVRVGESCYGNVYEKVGTKTLSETIMDEPERSDELLRKYAQLYRQIHETPVDSRAFPRAKEIFHGYIDGCRDWYKDDELSSMHKLVDGFPERDLLIHGDYHTRNVMVHGNELVLIDLGDMSVGHPVFDFVASAMTQATLLDNEPATTEIFVGMKGEYIAKGWDMLLEESFPDRTEKERESIDRMLRRLARIKIGCMPVVASGVPEDMLHRCVEDAKQTLLPCIDELVGMVGALDW